jgi:hypothetical protein
VRTTKQEEQAARVFDRRFLAALSVLMVIAVMGYLFSVTFVAMPTTGVKYADIAVPLLLGTVIGGVVGFWFGASKVGTTKEDGPITVDTEPKEPQGNEKP